MPAAQSVDINNEAEFAHAAKLLKRNVTEKRS